MKGDLTMTEIEMKIREIMAQNLELTVPIESVDSDELITNIGINSISFIKLVVFIESEFGIEFEDQYLDYKMISTLSKMAKYVEDRIGK